MARNTVAPGQAAGAESIGTMVTDQLSLAAYLAALGWQPKLVALASGKVLFEFATTDTLKADVLAFHAGNDSVDPDEFKAALVSLRCAMEAACARNGERRRRFFEVKYPTVRWGNLAQGRPPRAMKRPRFVS